MPGLTEARKESISEAYLRSIKYNVETILKGRCLVVDPSSGGNSSLPAVAILNKGKIETVSEIEVSPQYRTRGAYVGHRLQEIGQWMSENMREEFDLLAIELVYHEPSPSTVMKSYQQLIMSIGAIHATVKARYRIVVPPWDWHRNAPEGYVKSDSGDVRLMAHTIVGDAKQLSKKPRVRKSSK